MAFEANYLNKMRPLSSVSKGAKVLLDSKNYMVQSVTRFKVVLVGNGYCLTLPRDKRLILILN